jgi:hypothetical protein
MKQIKRAVIAALAQLLTLHLSFQIGTLILFFIQNLDLNEN